MFPSNMQSRHIACIHTTSRKIIWNIIFLYTPLYSKAFHLITMSLSWSMSLWWTVTTRPWTALCFIQRFLGIGSLNFYWTLDMTYAYDVGHLWHILLCSAINIRLKCPKAFSVWPIRYRAMKLDIVAVSYQWNVTFYFLGISEIELY